METYLKARSSGDRQISSLANKTSPLSRKGKDDGAFLQPTYRHLHATVQNWPNGPNACLKESEDEDLDAPFHSLEVLPELTTKARPTGQEFR